MNWGKKLKAWLIGRGINAGNLGLIESASRERMAQEAAYWQRDQLRTDEAVERAARAVNDEGWTCYGGGWPSRPVRRL